jgi:hypothetical protein
VRTSVRLVILVLSVVVMGAIAVTQSGTPVEALGARERLLGTWRLISGGTLRPDGSFEPYPEYGADPIGYLMYDTTGHMCVSLSNRNHPRWAVAEKPRRGETAFVRRIFCVLRDLGSAREGKCGDSSAGDGFVAALHRNESESPFSIRRQPADSFR